MLLAHTQMGFCREACSDLSPIGQVVLGASEQCISRGMPKSLQENDSLQRLTEIEERPAEERRPMEGRKHDDGEKKAEALPATAKRDTLRRSIVVFLFLAWMFGSAGQNRF